MLCTTAGCSCCGVLDASNACALVCYAVPSPADQPSPTTMLYGPVAGPEAPRPSEQTDERRSDVVVKQRPSQRRACLCVHPPLLLPHSTEPASHPLHQLHRPRFPESPVQATSAQLDAASSSQHQHSSHADGTNGAAPQQGKPKGKGKGKRGRGGAGGNGPAAGASTVSSGVKLEDVAITFKNQQVLRGVSWDVKTSERVGLVGECSTSSFGPVSWTVPALGSALASRAGSAD